MASRCGGSSSVVYRALLAEPPPAADALQPTLRCGFRARLRRSVSASGPQHVISLEVLHMTKVEELARAVASLTAEEYREFRRWFLERDWEHWDQQIEEDSRAGKLDFLVREALEAKQQGKLEELGGTGRPRGFGNTIGDCPPTSETSPPRTANSCRAIRGIPRCRSRRSATCGQPGWGWRIAPWRSRTGRIARGCGLGPMTTTTGCSGGANHPRQRTGGQRCFATQWSRRQSVVVRPPPLSCCVRHRVTASGASRCLTSKLITRAT
jgi:hypothetical protein